MAHQPGLLRGGRGKTLVYCEDAGGFSGSQMFYSRGKRDLLGKEKQVSTLCMMVRVELTAQAQVFVGMAAQPYAV